MKTASHFNYFGPGRIVISRGSPRGVPAGYRLYSALAPESRCMLKLSYPEYNERYLAQLARLDPALVWKDLHRLAGAAEPVLQCFEKPPFNDRNFCHRPMVATWFEHELGVSVPESEFIA